MLNFGNKDFRNLQEQVLFNANELKALKQLRLGGVEITAIYETSEEIPAQAGAYLVGTGPYQLYIKTESTLYNLGDFPKAGPTGSRGIEGPRGLQGERGTSWTIGTDFPANGKLGDFHLKYDGKVYQHDGEEYKYAFSIRGPQGTQGSPGPQGPQGPQGIRGEKGEPGMASSAVRVIGILSNIEQLPDPAIVSRDSAYIIQGDLYIITGEEDLVWTEAGPAIWSLKANNVSFDSYGTGLMGGNVQSALESVGNKFNTIDDMFIQEPLKNLFDINAILDGWRFDNDGELIHDNTGFTTDFIEIDLGKIYSSYFDTTVGERRGASMRRIAGYDANKNFVEMVSIAPITGFTNIDENIKYIRASYPNSTYKNELMLYRPSRRGLDNITEPYVPYQSNLKVKNEIMDRILLEDKKYPKYITTNASQSDFTFIKDKLFIFTPSDISAGYGYIHVAKPNIKDLTTNFVRTSIKHNLGHVNTVDYNEGNDCLIFGNGSGSYIPNNGKFYIMKDPYEKILTVPENGSIDLATNTIEYDCTSLDLGAKLNACWGYDNHGRNDIAILITNDNGIFTFVQLGKGENDLGLGNFIEETDDDEFNGSFTVIKQFILEGREPGTYGIGDNVNQGSVYYNGYLYLAIGHAPNRYWKVSFRKDGVAKYEEIYEPFADTNGTLLESTGYANEGITITKDHLLLGLAVSGKPFSILIKDLK